jgi:hypothetical protein
MNKHKKKSWWTQFFIALVGILSLLFILGLVGSYISSITSNQQTTSTNQETSTTSYFISPFQQCQNQGNIWCNGICYNPCPTGKTPNCPATGKLTCTSTQSQETTESYSFSVYENKQPYYGAFCDKINPYDLNVREASSSAIRNHPGTYNNNQLFDIYDWIKQNIVYQNVPLTGIPYQPSETLATKSGDCKNQAVLIASMVESIGGTAKVVVDPDCEHAYTIVYFGPSGSDISWFTQAVSNHYGSDVSIRYFTYGDGIWIIFDPAGGNYPGSTLPECSGNRTVYFLMSCLDCVNQYPNTPYTFGDKCYSQCPSGTITANQYACKSCPKGYYSFNNECVTCPSGYYLAVNGKCYPR